MGHAGPVEIPLLLNLDPPRHSEFGAMQPAFARGALGSWQAMVDQLAHELVSELLANPIGYGARAAVPLPLRMLAHILGIPPDDGELFRYRYNETAGGQYRVRKSLWQMGPAITAGATCIRTSAAGSTSTNCWR